MRRAFIRALSASCVATGNFATVGDTLAVVRVRSSDAIFIAAIFRY
jgi:hypothetical protein